MSYRRMTFEDRIKIHLLLHEEKSKAEIARKIKKHRSSVSREIARNTGGRGYRPKQAQKFADSREVGKHIPYKMTEQIESTIIKHLKKKWSPEQIYNRLKIDSIPICQYRCRLY